MQRLRMRLLINRLAAECGDDRSKKPGHCLPGIRTTHLGGRVRAGCADFTAHRISGDAINSATIIVGAANEWMRRFHDRMPVILDWRDAGTWMTGDDPGAPPEDALQEWIVSPCVNRSGVGDDDRTLIEAVAAT